MPVIQVTESVRLEANHVYVIPPGKQLVMDGDTLRLEEPERALEAGFNAHLVKPLESSVLERMLEQRSWS